MDMKVLEQLIAQGGTTAQKLLAGGMNVNALRTNATLRKDEWKILDEAIVEEAQLRLVGVADLIQAGLVFNLSNGLGKTILESETVSDMRDAELSMDGVTQGRDDTVNFELVGLPLPIIHKGYSISIRKLNASRERGEPLDVTQARLSSRKVSELVENILFNGHSSYTYGGYVIYGYTDFPSRLSASMTAHWDVATGAQIVADVLEAKAKLLAKHMFGPFQIYIPAAYETALDADYSSAKGDNTIRDRILAITGIKGIKVADKLTGDKVIVVQQTPDVVRMVVGLPMTNVEWKTEGDMIFNFKVMTIQVPQLRVDQAGNCGICEIA